MKLPKKESSSVYNTRAITNVLGVRVIYHVSLSSVVVIINLLLLNFTLFTTKTPPVIDQNSSKHSQNLS